MPSERRQAPEGQYHGDIIKSASVTSQTHNTSAFQPPRGLPCLASPPRAHPRAAAEPGAALCCELEPPGGCKAAAPIWAGGGSPRTYLVLKTNFLSRFLEPHRAAETCRARRAPAARLHMAPRPPADRGWGTAQRPLRARRARPGSAPPPLLYSAWIGLGLTRIGVSCRAPGPRPAGGACEAAKKLYSS